LPAAAIAAAFGCLFVTTCLYAQDTAAPRGIADLSLEELMTVTITSVSKREEKLVDAAAAIFVL
jgi:iron complex outermembrane receptor protein